MLLSFILLRVSYVFLNFFFPPLETVKMRDEMWGET